MPKRQREAQRDRLLELLADGQARRRIDLVRAGFSQGVIARLLERGAIEKAGSAGVRIWGAKDISQEARYAGLAAVFGPKGGVLTCHAALDLHFPGLMDETDINYPNAVLLPFAAHKGSGGAELKAKVLRTRRPDALAVGVEARSFLGHGLGVTDLPRTLCDMLAPWAIRAAFVAEGAETAALVRIATMDQGGRVINQAFKYAERLGWGMNIASLYQTVVAARSFRLEQMRGR
jgi:hypothetical protein